jgi:hypothetical protein
LYSYVGHVGDRSDNGIKCEQETYLLPPDLLVEILDRATMEAIIREMLAKNELRSAWLCE